MWGNVPAFQSRTTVPERSWVVMRRDRQSQEITGLQHPASTCRSIWGELAYTDIRKGRKGQCHGIAKSLCSEVKDNMRVSALLGDFAEDFLASLSLNFLIYKMAIITILAFKAGPPWAVQALGKHLCGSPVYTIWVFSNKWAGTILAAQSHTVPPKKCCFG